MIAESIINKRVYTLKSIVCEAKNVLFVAHGEDGEWQFLDGEEVFLGDLMMVTFMQLIGLDKSLEVLLDLKSGFEANRSGLHAGWIISKSE